jgi:predicted DNA-binding transcriptional regulator AlpA
MRTLLARCRESTVTKLGIPVNTLYGWRCRGEGPPGYRIGRQIRYRRAAVETWLETQTDHERTVGR